MLAYDVVAGFTFVTAVLLFFMPSPMNPAAVSQGPSSYSTSGLSTSLLNKKSSNSVNNNGSSERRTTRTLSSASSSASSGGGSSSSLSLTNRYPLADYIKVHKLMESSILYEKISQKFSRRGMS